MRRSHTRQTRMSLTLRIRTTQGGLPRGDGLELTLATLGTLLRIQRKQEGAGEIPEVLLVHFGVLRGEGRFRFLPWFGVLDCWRNGSVGVHGRVGGFGILMGCLGLLGFQVLCGRGYGLRVARGRGGRLGVVRGIGN